MSTAAITIGLSPTISIGPLTIAWHGLTIALGLLLGTILALRMARERGLDEAPVLDGLVAVTVAGIVGARLFYLAQNDAAALLRPAEWFSTRGFAFYGAMLLGVPAAALVLRRRGAGLVYLDIFALSFLAGMAVGRIGDVISGEHYGPRSSLPWAFAYTSPDAEVPLKGVGYVSGAFYEIVGCALLFAVLWPLRHRFRTPTVALWTVIAGYAAVRFALFFDRRDAPIVGLGLRQAQWTSLALAAVAVAGIVFARRRLPPRRFGPRGGAPRPLRRRRPKPDSIA